MVGNALTILGIGQVRVSRPKRARLTHSMLLARRDHLLRQFSDAVGRSRNARMRRLYQELAHVNELLEVITPDPDLQPTTLQRPAYVVSSLFLEQCFRELTADASEQFFFITGAEVAGTRVLDQRIEFAHDKRTAVGVSGNMEATHHLLIRLEQYGHRLLAHFHSHPGLGVEGTHPSGTDTAFQRRLETGGYPTIAAIFSRDGYIRFFRLDDTFTLRIHGTGVDDLGQHTYRLTTVSPSHGRSDSRS